MPVNICFDSVSPKPILDHNAHLMEKKKKTLLTLTVCGSFLSYYKIINCHSFLSVHLPNEQIIRLNTVTG